MEIGLQISKNNGKNPLSNAERILLFKASSSF